MRKRFKLNDWLFGKAFVVSIALLVLCLGLLTSCKNAGDSYDTDSMGITEAEAEQMIALVDEIADMDAQNASAEEVYTYLDSLDWIENVRYEDDGNISCRTTFGITAVWGEKKDGYIGSASSNSAEPSLEEQLETVEKFAGDGLDIVILCPYASTDSSFIIDGYKDMADKITETVSGSVTVLEDEDVSLEALKSLDQYDMVFFYSHGWLSSVINSAWALAPSDPYTMTGEFADSAKLYLLSSDFFFGRTIIDLSDGRIGIGGNFYTYYYEKGDMENMFFHFGSCYSMHTSTISDALLSLGAAWVEGWSDSVTFENDFMHMYAMGACLICGYSAQESVGLILADVDVQQYAQSDCSFVTAGDGTYQITVIEEENIDSNREEENDHESTYDEARIELLDGYWESFVQARKIYQFFEDGTVKEYDIEPIASIAEENLFYSRTLNYQFDGKQLILTRDDGYQTVLELVTTASPVGWDTGLTERISAIPDGTEFFYETSWQDLGDFQNAMYLVKADNNSTAANLYKQVLQLCSGSYLYTLYDIDENGTPELIIAESTNSFQVYAFDGNEAVFCGYLFSNYTDCLYEYEGNGLLVWNGGIGGFAHEEYIEIYTLTGNSLEMGESIIGGVADGDGLDELRAYLENLTPIQDFVSVTDYSKLSNYQ